MKIAFLIIFFMASCSSIKKSKREISIHSTPSGADLSIIMPTGEYKNLGKTPHVVSADLLQAWEELKVEFVTFKISQAGHIPENINVNVKDNYNIQISTDLKGVDVWSNKDLEMSSSTANKLALKIQKINQQIFKKELSEALKNTENLIEEFPKAHVFYDMRGSIYYLMRNKKEAILNYEKSLSLQPDNFEAKNMLQKVRGEKE